MANPDGLEQASIEKSPTELGQVFRTVFPPTLEVVARTEIIVGQEARQIQSIGVPEPALHDGIAPDVAGPQSTRELDELFQHPVADDVQAVVVDTAVHQVSDHQVVLHSHQSFRMDGKVTVRGKGHPGQDPLGVQLSIPSSGGVAVSEQIVESVAVELTADQAFDHRSSRSALFQQGCNRVSKPGREALERIVDRWIVSNYGCRPGFMVQPEHLLAGMAQRPMADVVEEGRGVEQTSFLFQCRVQTDQVGQCPSSQMEHPQ